MTIDEVIQQPGQEQLLIMNAIKEQLHVAAPGKIISYNETTRSANVQLSIRNWNRRENPPILPNVPVFFPGNFTFPVTEGDECLVVFADSCIDAWYRSGGLSTAISPRKHDLSDGFAFVGFFSNPNANGGVNLAAKLEELEERIQALEGGGS